MSAVERKPAQRVAQPLVVEHKFSDLVGELGAMKFLFFSGRARVRRWEIVIPIAAVAVLGYVVCRNVWPIPGSDQPAFWYTVATAVWLLGALLFVCAMPGLARRVSDQLESDEGLAAASR